jgi:hypothetical protein
MTSQKIGMKLTHGYVPDGKDSYPADRDAAAPAPEP